MSLATIADRKTISIMKACDLVGVSRRTIYNWITNGKVEYVRTAVARFGSSSTRCGATRVIRHAHRWHD